MKVGPVRMEQRVLPPGAASHASVQTTTLERRAAKLHVSLHTIYCGWQGFMQDKGIASHTCFGGHVDVNC